jgi:hypothetical protein
MANRPLHTSDQPILVPEVIANEALRTLGNYLNLGKTVIKDTDLTPTRVGEVIKIPRRGAVTALQKAKGSPTVLQTPTMDNIEVTIDQHWYVKMGEEDASFAVQQGSALPPYLEDSVISLAEKIEQSLIDHTDEFGSNLDVSGANALDGVIAVRERFAMNKVPKLLERFGYVHPTLVSKLMREDTFTDPKTIPTSRPLIEGSVGRVQGFDMFEGQMVEAKGSPAWYQNFFYTKFALVLASRPLRDVESKFGVESTVVQSEAGLALRVLRYYDPSDLAMVFHVDVLFGAGVNDSRQGIVLESQ